MNTAKQKKANILIVDDNKLILAIARDALVEDGHKVRTLSEAKDVYREILKEPPDILVLDIMMPDLDGIEITRRIKRNIDTKHIVIIIHTVKKDPELFELCREAGADHILIKSSEIELMIDLIRDIQSQKIVTGF